ncbi:unnamed protein product [Heligmosomoides polygyrus]|uniref:Uncharacterized protein n=1 Tax=Heligmosomoides polygyrus TaxID=6339 RepID=A0A3P8FP95_HELPZ|nr:unnamed protein product [Heligmosomoides polygyrus]
MVKESFESGVHIGIEGQHPSLSDVVINVGGQSSKIGELVD